MKPVEYDKIGYWSEVKLDIVKKYAAAYTTILSKQPSIKKYIYIDAFAGAGTAISRTTGEFVKGSPLNALNVTPPFSELHLIDLDGGKTAELRKIVGTRQNVFIYEGDANRILVEQIFPRCRYEDYARALCLLDPYALMVDWDVIKAAGEMKSIEMFYNFMIMDLNMNMLRHHPETVLDTQAERLDKVWGDSTWRESAYTKQRDMFGDTSLKKNRNPEIAEAFKNHLEKDAGFAYVPKPIPMRNEKSATIYYLYFASPNNKGAKIVEDIFTKYRTRGMS